MIRNDVAVSRPDSHWIQFFCKRSVARRSPLESRQGLPLDSGSQYRYQISTGPKIVGSRDLALQGQLMCSIKFHSKMISAVFYASFKLSPLDYVTVVLNTVLCQSGLQECHISMCC